MFFLPGEEKPIPLAPYLKWAVVISLVLVFVIGLYPQPFIKLGTASVQMLAVAF